MRITVAICTWNRAKLLDQTLAQMRSLRIPEGVDWELIVVNNNCTDDTDAVLERYASTLPLRRFFEPNPGKSYAANRVVAEAKGELILWTDDDVLVEPDWFGAYVQASRAAPSAAFFGGTVEPWFEITPPRWIARHLGNLADVFAVRQFGKTDRLLEPGEMLVGANLATRTDVIRRFPFDPRRGPRGADPRNGEETDLLERMMRAGFSGYWVGTAQVRHFIPRHRLTPRYVWNWFRWFGRMNPPPLHLESVPRLFGLPRWLLRLYWSARIRAALLGAVKSPAWFEAFLASARWKGILDYCREQESVNAKPLPICAEQTP